MSRGTLAGRSDTRYTAVIPVLKATRLPERVFDRKQADEGVYPSSAAPSANRAIAS